MARFPLPTARFGYDGSVLMAQYAGSLSETWAFPASSFSHTKHDSRYVTPVIDANSNNHVQTYGLRYGELEFAAPLMPDRNAVTFINAATSLATRALPFQANLLPFSGGSTDAPASIFIRSIRLYGQSAVDGRTSQVMMQVRAYTCDPDNAQGLAALVAPATLGSNGAGVTNFGRSSLTDASATPLDYRMTSFDLMQDNQVILSSERTPGQRLSEGGIMGPATGTLSVSQDRNAVNQLPKAAGQYVFLLNLPTGDISHTATGTLNLSHDDDGISVQPTTLVRQQVSYGLFNPTSGASLMSWSYL